MLEGVSNEFTTVCVFFCFIEVGDNLCEDFDVFLGGDFFLLEGGLIFEGGDVFVCVVFFIEAVRFDAWYDF